MSTKPVTQKVESESNRGAEGAGLVIENRSQECARIVKRLLEMIDRHVASLTRSGLSISWTEMQLVVLALEADADGRDVNVHLDGADEISAYVKRNLYDELVGEPSNIFYTTQVDGKTVRYEALPKDFWRECLSLLRQKLKELREKT
jgi:hypothetical protein